MTKSRRISSGETSCLRRVMAGAERRETGDHAINWANTLHSLFHGFLSVFRGVSTKRLDEYLAWLLWRRTYTQDRESIAVRQVDVTPCDNTVRDWAYVMPPYMDYWGVAA
ncbi:transposase [Bifidobacterium porcinum]|uniref:transposase n=1 Tax=Bifidobacterium porcinum TaxID=212365 RepID=UPI00399298ED